MGTSTHLNLPPARLRVTRLLEQYWSKVDYVISTVYNAAVYRSSLNHAPIIRQCSIERSPLSFTPEYTSTLFLYHRPARELVTMSHYDNLRMLTLPTPNPKRQKYQTLWIDLLPIDICGRIISFLPCSISDQGRQSQFLPDVLAMASVSAVQAVAVGKQTNLSIEHATSPQHTAILICAWLDFLHDIVSVHLPVEITDSDEVRHVLSLQSIRKVSVPNYPVILRQLPKLHFLRSIELRLTQYCPQNGQKGLSTGLSTVLRTCPVEELRIICLGCNSCPHLPCFTVRLLQPLKVGRQCTTLKSLMLKCTSHHMDSLAKSPAVFPNLENFHIEHWVSADHDFLDQPIQLHLSEPMSACLKKVNNVTIHNCGSVGSFLPDLAHNLCGLRSIVEVIPVELIQLGTCANLRSIDLLLGAGIEVWFPRELETLLSVSLTWHSKEVLALHEQYELPIPGIILGIIRRNKEIQELRLNNVSITPELLEELLRMLGSKLRSLHVPILHQGEAPSARVIRLGRLLLRYNQGLTRLYFCTAAFRRIAKTRVTVKHEWRICDANVCEFCELRKQAECLRDALSRRYKGFCEEGLKAILVQLEPLC